jgi:hypothetical protein
MSKSQQALKTFKRLSESKILLEDIVWDKNPHKAVDMRNPETGDIMQSIIVEGLFYYPTGYYGKKPGKLVLENESE